MKQKKKMGKNIKEKEGYTKGMAKEKKDGMSLGRKRLNTKDMALIGVMAALLCVTGPMVFPVPASPVPVSLGSLVVYLGVYALGKKRSSMACVIYLLIGFFGLPVFSGFAGGPGKIFGPTGGYIIGYVFMSYIGGVFIEKWKDRKLMHLLGIMGGTMVCYLLGTVWLMIQAELNLYVAFFTGVVPFIPGDIAKVLVALILGSKIKNSLRKSGVI